MNRSSVQSSGDFDGADGIKSHCIGFLGAEWWGSDARALCVELRNQGHLLVECHYESFLSTKWKSIRLKVIRRLLRGQIAAEYNRAVTELLAIEAMDFLLVFKGMLLERETLQKFRDAGKACYCVYPDVSFLDHGRNIWDCLPLYNCLFTTKSYHLQDPALSRRVHDIQFVPHGFDPDVHRPVVLRPSLQEYYGCDVAFVGVWSPKKEQMLARVIGGVPNARVKIWGPSWQHATAAVRSCWQGRAAYGDELAAICSAAKINFGLLSEAGSGTVVGDQTTARTWQIPACGGFMLHEDTGELRNAFVPGLHVEVFDGADNLVELVRRYTIDHESRDRIRHAGHAHCIQSGYSYRRAADQILSYHAERSTGA